MEIKLIKASYCKNCTTETGRHPGCQAECDKYKQYREEYEHLMAVRKSIRTHPADEYLRERGIK